VRVLVNRALLFDETRRRAVCARNRA